MTDLKPIEYTPPTLKESDFLTWASKEAGKRANETRAQRVARITPMRDEEIERDCLEYVEASIAADSE